VKPRTALVIFVGLVNSAFSAPGIGVELGGVEAPEAMGGRFALKKLRLSRDKPSSQARITGEIENRTGLAWNNVDFTVFLGDKSGREFKTPDGCFATSKLGTGATESSSCVFSGQFDFGSVRITRAVRSQGWVTAKYSFSLVSPAASRDLMYMDERVALELFPGERGIGLKIRNKLPDPVKLDWNQSSFVDWHGKSGRIIHDGVRFVERNSLLPPSVIPPGALLEDSIVPVSNIDLVGTMVLTDALFPARLPKAAELKGARVSVLLYLEANGVSRNYMLTVQVDDVVPN